MRLLGAAVVAAAALAVLAFIHAGVLDTGAIVVEVAALLMLAHATFRLLDPAELTRESVHRSEQASHPRRGRLGRRA